MSKKLLQNLLVILLLLPVLFINIKVSHDWGDDFAQYLHQSQNLISGESQNTTGYIFNSNYFIGPQAYPVGFPLILAPIVSKFGLSLKHLNYYMSCFLILSCLIGFILLRKHTSFLTSLITTLIFAYNPMMLNFKTEVLSDLPYTFFSLTCIYLMMLKPKLATSILLGFLLAFSAHIRSIGLLLIFVFTCYTLIQILKAKNYKLANYKNESIVLIVCGLVYFSFKFIFPYNSNYPSLFETEHLWLNANNHVSYNFDKLTTFFTAYELKNFFYINVIASSSLITFSIIGFVKYFQNVKYNPITIYVLTYLFVIIAFKFGDTGLRFLFPILIFFFLFSIIGMHHMLVSLHIYKKGIAVFIGALVLFSYSEEIERIIQKTPEVLEGPQKKSAVDMFNYINLNIPKGTIIEFDKPRALALYTHANSFAFNPYSENLNISLELKQFNASYLLTDDIVTPLSTRDFAKSDTINCKLISSYGDMNLYKLK